MEIKIDWKNIMDKPLSFDTKTTKLVALPGRGKRMFGPDEIDAEFGIEDGIILSVGTVRTGDVESTNALCKEIVRRFNEFPEDKKL